MQDIHTQPIDFNFAISVVAMQEGRLKLLQEMPIFGGIRADVIEYLLTLTPIVEKDKGEFFCREGDEADSMFVLEQGQVAILKNWKGREYLLNELKAGDCFGEIAVMDLGRRTCAVVAREACSAIEIPTSALYSIYKKDLEQFTIIQMNLGRETSRRLRLADQRIFEAKVEVPLVEGDYIFR